MTKLFFNKILVGQEHVKYFALKFKEISLQYWAKAINCANYIFNRTPTKFLQGITSKKKHGVKLNQM